MALGRVTQNMMVRQSLTAIETNSSRAAKLQEQLASGRRLNRPSDSPTDTIEAMRVRAEAAANKQFAANAQDGIGWLGQLDTTLASMTSQVRRARELALTGANEGAMSPASREALAVEVDQIRESLITQANTDYLGRPVFGGVTAGSKAYDADGTYIGTPAAVNRTVADGVSVRVDVDGLAVFGTAGDSLFDDLAALSSALRAGDGDEIRAGIDILAGRMTDLTNTQVDVGIRQKRLDDVLASSVDTELTLTARLSDLEDVDLVKTAIDVKLADVAYQASLASSARVLSTSLMDYLR
ncbi:flagellar hook-associated protein 3 FlgL [Nocardioides daedukensis]|uniref:Flagellar hook-associated protein 3 FlgL n=1 Tax=Nocardioides daedukensis TaxID=634462 RepID=A0A7Y9S238_9ACTN|nr:flagellar hook-associated protein FlgL [Nocardioides daedukensis]NYG58698.1 flagellar hook-associated protein 3 FlgL [Nocardioides daedukensis]